MISYTISVYNELEELKKLLHIVKSAITTEDELIIVQTYRDITETHNELFHDIQSLCLKHTPLHKTFHFKNQFATMKNYLNSFATKKYIINFDADELVSADTILLWKKFIINNNNDLYFVPRINIVDDYTIDDIKKYKWTINENNWINWPDYQPRIFKNNGQIRWSGDVHEHLEGYINYAPLPLDPRLAIIHHKNIYKQRQQNNLYDQINNSL